MCLCRTWSVMLTVLVHVFLVLHAVQCLEPGAPVHSGALDLPWQDELCCDSPPANVHAKEGRSQTEINLPHPPLCKLKSSTAESQPPMPPGGKNHPASDHQVVCDAEESLVCSIHLNSTRALAVRVMVNISSVAASTVLLRVPPRPVKPSPPFNLSHIQTVEAELILSWKAPLDLSHDLLRYEVRYSSPKTLPQVVSALEKPNLSLDLKPSQKYTIQVRCTTQTHPSLWSDWSQPYHIYLQNVSYIPEEVLVRPGEKVTVYCVLNGNSTNASMAMWSLNGMVPLDPSLYRPINERVSQITFNASKTGMYDVLRCTQKWTIPYSQINVEGESAEMSCEEMKEKERGGEDVGEMGPECSPKKSKEKVCSIHPLKISCYKLWLEMPSNLGLIRCKPVYVSPINHVKANPPTDVMAVSRSGGILRVSWSPPLLPAEGLQCQFRYHSLSVIEKWKFEEPVRVPWAEVKVPDMCQVYVVQVRCMHTSGIGYWSEWSDAVHSTNQSTRGRPASITYIHLEGSFKNLHFTNSNIFKHNKISILGHYGKIWTGPQFLVCESLFLSFTAGRCVHSFHVSVINSTCVSLSWSLLHISSVPLFMVVQWFPTKQQDTEDFGLSGQTWARLPYTSLPALLRGDFFSSKEYAFHLYPVFADGEGEPMFAGKPPAYLMLMFISFLCIGVFVTLALSQNQMKKIVWKDVPNPNKCSWAKALDLKTMDRFEYLFQPAEGLQALSLPPEKISKVIVVNKALTEALVQTPKSLPPESVVALTNSFLPCSDPRTDQLLECDTVLRGAISSDSLTTSNKTNNKLQAVDGLVEQGSGTSNSSARSSVTYTKVLVTDANQDHPPLHLHYKEGSGCSSSDEGNFSANNSDTSESFPGGLWEQDSCRGTESDDARRSCSYNSVKELSETSEQEDEVDIRQEKPLYYLEIGHPPDDEESEAEKPKTELLKSVHLNREDCPVELHPLLSPEESMDASMHLQATTCSFASLYMPQYRKTEVNHIPDT
uniref:Leptin receptor n=1 Tax=Fundulus heteroclitus TaxID=8078 RepID=A0A3Q2Q696_FUNHE